MRVVIVDDSEDLRRLLSLVLTEAGHQVVGEAPDGAQGVEEVERRHPDAVVLDYDMPVMSGLEALPRMLSACPATRVVLFTSGMSGAVQEAARGLGAAAVLEKTAGVDALLEALTP
ncbi:MAG TPA: response regulator [Acidimicrobiales bacterium]|nr:response regulator [Acidimicrobiales bacterium]